MTTRIFAHTKLALTAFAVSLSPTVGAKAQEVLPEEIPRLTVVIIVDQMRADYLDRYDAYFEGGLRRILDQGQVHTNAWVDHAYTNSLPGHATLVTGTYPRTHGIIDNVWHMPSEGADVVRSGHSLVDRRDGMPYSLGAATLPELLRQAYPDSRFAAIGTNSASRLYAGALEGPVFWFDAESGFVTNANYAASAPDWVTEFNGSLLARYGSDTWNTMLPHALSASLRPDASPFENGGDRNHFPHTRDAESQTEREWIAATPMLDAATLDLSMKAVRELGLGDDAVPDVLMISLESLDAVGHAFGPFSHEQTDAILRLDRNLGTMFAELDRELGSDGWMLALSADHGVNITPEQRRIWGSVEGERVSRERAQQFVDAVNAATEGIADHDERAAAAAAAAETFDFVRAAYTEREVASFAEGVDSIEGLLALSYVPGRIPAHPFYIRNDAVPELGIYVVLHEDIMMDWGTAIHGSQYDYDRRVPLVFIGGPSTAGEREERVATVDLAPSLLAAWGIARPAEIDGRALIDR